MADATSVEMLLLWMRVVRSVVENAELAFQDYYGESLVYLERKIKTAMKEFGHSLPSATSLRKQLKFVINDSMGH